MANNQNDETWVNLAPALNRGLIGLKLKKKKKKKSINKQILPGDKLFSGHELGKLYLETHEQKTVQSVPGLSQPVPTTLLHLKCWHIC